MPTFCTYIKITDEVAATFHSEEFLSHLRIQGLTPDTQLYYMRFIHHFISISPLEKCEDFDNFIKVKFAYYNLFSREIGNNTIYKYYKCIKKYCDFLKENGYIEKVHISQIQRVKTTNPLPKALREEDLGKIRDYVMSQNKSNPFIQMRNYMLLETILYTGLRRIELTQLKKVGIFENHIIVEQGKGQKDRIVYIPKDFSKQLGAWLEIQSKNSEYVFCNANGSQLSRNAVSCLFHRIEKALGLKVSSHLLRHTYASICVKRGINLYTLQQQMGHTNLKTTSIYLYLNSKENWEEMQKLRI